VKGEKEEINGPALSRTAPPLIEIVAPQPEPASSKGCDKFD